MRRSLTPLLALASVLSSVVFGCGGEPPPEGAPPPAAAHPPSDAAIARGRDHYTRYCSLCHGANAEGYAADNASALGNDDLLRVATDDYLRTAIAEGHAGTPMSAWHRNHGGPLDDAMIRELVAYLRSLGDGPPIDTTGTRIAGDRGRGEALFAEHCASCHGAHGEGVTAVSLASEVFLRTATDGFVRETIARGREGTPMQGFADRLSSEDIDDLTTYVRSLAPRRGPPPGPQGPPPPALDALVIHPEGTPPNFQLRDNRFVAGQAVRDALDAGQRIILLDARAPSDWAANHIPGAAPFPFYASEELVQHVPDHDTWIVAYCACPHAASGRVVDQLRAAGFERTAVLDEGIGWWIQQGFPVERGSVP